MFGDQNLGLKGLSYGMTLLFTEIKVLFLTYQTTFLGKEKEKRSDNFIKLCTRFCV